MVSFVEVAKTGEFQDGTMKRFLVQGNEILVARVGGNYYAVDNRCPHFGGRLDRGSLEGTIVTCPRHGSRFELKDGAVVRWLRGAGLLTSLSKAIKSPRPLRTYNLKIEGDALLVEV